MPSPREPGMAPATGELILVQRAFAAALLDPMHDDTSGMTVLLEHLGGDPERNRRRFRAYQRNVLGNWVAALASTTPAVAAALGDEAFRRVARAYAASHDSPSGDLNEYGADFAGHLAATPGLPPWLADLARLEWAMQAAYYAADSAPFDFASLATVPAEHHGQLCFSFAPAFRMLHSQWPLAELWQTLLTGAMPAAVSAGPRTTWVVRPWTRVWAESAGAGEAAFVAALADSVALGLAIERGMAGDPDFDVGAALARLAQLGVLAGFSLEGEDR